MIFVGTLNEMGKIRCSRLPPVSAIIAFERGAGGLLEQADDELGFGACSRYQASNGCPNAAESCRAMSKNSARTSCRAVYFKIATSRSMGHHSAIFPGIMLPVRCKKRSAWRLEGVALGTRAE